MQDVKPNPRRYDKWIKRTEEEIVVNLTKLHEMEGPLRDYKEVYETLQLQYDSLKAEIDNDKELKDEMVRRREGYGQKKDLRQLTTTSATNKPPRTERSKKGKVLPWTEWTEEILIEAGRFMSAQDLFSTIIERHRDMFKDKREISKYRWSYINVIMTSSDKTVRKSNKRKGAFVKYVGKNDATGNGKYGLVDWVDDSFVPLPKYMKEFMYNEREEQGAKILRVG